MTEKRIAYDYTVLRYVHDITTGEFINIGVLASSKDGQQVCTRFRTTFTRIKGAFPSLDGDAFRLRVRALRSFFRSLANRDLETELIQQLNRKAFSTLEYANLAIPSDDSSLQWSPLGSGVTVDLSKTTEKLFHRFVSAHDLDQVPERKKDEDVWQAFSTALERRNVARLLVEKTIEVEDDSIKFSHAWKNGNWHCFEPLSFDLASEDSIKGKAHRWLGRLASVQSSPETFKVYFLVGKPGDSSRSEAYAGALNILRKFENATVVEEHETQEFSVKIAEKMSRHISSANGELS